jgi:MATE family multidrug resistance protein
MSQSAISQSDTLYQNPPQWGQEFLAIARLAWPLVVAQLASILLFTTDVVMMGWLGPTHLAAGTLATSLLHPVF